MYKRVLLFAIVTYLVTPVATAQSTRPSPPPPPETRAPDKFPKTEEQDTGFQHDMRIKMAIARAEGEHKKLLEDVEKLSNLSNEIAKGYGEHKKLSSDEIKKLGRIEKLARRVLTNSGGDEVDHKPDQMQLAEAIDKLNTTAECIKKEMTAETRFVVSATVIANSNEVISLARFIRQQKAN